MLGFGSKVEAGLPTVDKPLVDVRLERDGGGSGGRTLLEPDLSGGGLAARRSAITLAAAKGYQASLIS